ncbi:MAG: hypothetical protein GEU99_05980 [Luteitalea sp.]|nr:hypothetical protein [Luteitalea sp.]
MSRLGPGYRRRAPGLTEAHGDIVLYATSKDGIHWEKPSLDLHVFDGSRANNILFADAGFPSVLMDEKAAPPERYKMALWNWRESQFGYRMSHSADGLDWKAYLRNPGLVKNREVLEWITLARDPRTAEYVAFHRRWGEAVNDRKRRLIAVATSRDFQTWSGPDTIFRPDKTDDAWIQRAGQWTELYNMTGFGYGEQFLGLLSVFKVVKFTKLKAVSGANVSPWDGPIDVQLVHSRNGRDWERFEDRSPVIPRGSAGSFDAGCILSVASSPVIYNDEIWVYYTAINTTHGGPMPPKRITIGRAAWRLDGFVSLDAGSTGGVIETVPLDVAGTSLQINADASRGAVAVEVLSAAGEPLPGYALQDSNVIRSNGVRHLMTWKNESRLKAQGLVRLRFHLTNARLYSFRIK